MDKVLIPDGPQEGPEFPLSSNDYIEIIVKSTVLEEDEKTANRKSMQRSSTVKMLPGMQMDMGNFPYIPESPRVSGMLQRRETTLLIAESSQSFITQADQSVNSVAQLREKFKEKEVLF